MRVYHANKNTTLLDYIFGNRTRASNTSKKPELLRQRDTLIISDAARSMAVTKQKSHNHKNTDIDKTLDLHGFINSARNANAKALDNAGNTININAVPYEGTFKALESALNEKYKRASACAGSYSNIDAYLEDKYFNKTSDIYEADLSDAERRAGYKHEKSYIKKGTVGGIDFSDSLFRGMEFGDSIDRDRIQWERSVVNKQIDNILKESGIDGGFLSNSYKLTVDPYSYYISVEGAADDVRIKMEDALNKGENGKKLYQHIRKSAIQDGCNSKQISKDGYLKYQAASRVKEYGGIILGNITERDGSYYSDEGVDIVKAVDKGIEQKENKENQSALKSWVHNLIHDVAKIGWNNLPDMPLSIMLSKSGLSDIGQDIIFDGLI